MALTMATIEQLRQMKTRGQFLSIGSGEWMTVCDDWSRREVAHGGTYCYLSSPRQRARIVGHVSWDLSKGDGAPGFVQGGDSRGRTITRYRRFTTVHDVEPLVFYRNFHGVKPTYLELSEEFRQYHNLYNGGDGKYWKIEDDGNEYVAAEINDRLVRIRTGLVRQYQAARQMDLVLSIDSVVYFKGAAKEEIESIHEEVADDLSRVEVYGGDGFGGSPFTRLLAKRVLPPPARKFAGVWPYEQEDDHYPEFILKVDEEGRIVTHSCEPDRLANYFGANPEAPHYLTPVYFTRDVLQRYYDQPDKYSVEDGYLRCAGLWGLRMDNDLPDYVVVFLGDLGRDLPARERDYWKGFNVRPGEGISETAYRRGFLAEFADPESPDIRFRQAYGRFRTNWRDAVGWDLVRDPNPEDEHVLQVLRVPLTGNQSEFDAQALTLAKLMVDSLNEQQLASLVPPLADDAKGIDKLEAWLRQEKYPTVDVDVALLRRIQLLRSKSSAHRKGSDYQAMLSKAFGTTDRQGIMRQLLADATALLDRLAAHFQLGD